MVVFGFNFPIANFMLQPLDLGLEAGVLGIDIFPLVVGESVSLNNMLDTLWQGLACEPVTAVELQRLSVSLSLPLLRGLVVLKQSQIVTEFNPDSVFVGLHTIASKRLLGLDAGYIVADWLI